MSIGERFYDVDGTTAWRVNRDLVRKGPRLDGAGVQGLTDFRLRYSYAPRPWGEGCRAVATRVSVEVTTTLPLWEEREAAPEPLRRDWDLFLTRLRRHEQGHQEIAISGGRALLDQVEALRAPDCDALRAQARRLAQAFETRLAGAQRSWDDDTDHGLRGGG